MIFCVRRLYIFDFYKGKKPRYFSAAFLFMYKFDFFAVCNIHIQKNFLMFEFFSMFYDR